MLIEKILVLYGDSSLSFEHIFNKHSESERMKKVVPRFLVPQLKKGDEILSVGCGAGYDVFELRKLGYDAYGLDPSRLAIDVHPENLHPYFYEGRMHTDLFEGKKFNFIYALDVIEHVGCRSFGTILNPNYHSERVKYISACLSCLKPGGSLVLVTSNKLCPIDIGHWHKYHLLGRLFSERKKFGLSIPWSKKNFLVSLNDIENFVDSLKGKKNYKIKMLETINYPLASAKNGLWYWLVKKYISFVDKKIFRGTPLSPILIVKITNVS